MNTKRDKDARGAWHVSTYMAMTYLACGCFSREFLPSCSLAVLNSRMQH